MSKKQQKKAKHTSIKREKRHDRRDVEQLLHRPVLNEDKIYSFPQVYGTMEYNA